MNDYFLLIVSVAILTLALTWLGYRIGQDLKARRKYWTSQIQNARDMVWDLEKRIFKQRAGDSIYFKIVSRMYGEVPTPTLEERLTKHEQRLNALEYRLRELQFDQKSVADKGTKKKRRGK